MIAEHLVDNPLQADPYIMTVSGEIINFVRPDPQSFTLEDIATGMSHACRFAGQTPVWYSVAQHSLWVAERCKVNKLEALFHDASEAYMCDMPSPLKKLCPDYKVIEEKVSRAIAERFNLTYPWPDNVIQADHEQYFWERDFIVRAEAHDRNNNDINIMKNREVRAAWLTTVQDLL